MNTRIKVGGNIISELSEKIPNNIIALNELIKNSYDAGASSVVIDFDTSKQILRIKDDGCGMDHKNIDTLFHIAKSNKIHGIKNEYNRITQGSKGLGFLSVFKFGKYVEWKTNKNKGIEFSVNYERLISLDDLSEFEIELFEDDSIPHGTEIIINLDEYNVKSLIEYFCLERNYKKIIHSFDDNNFAIDLILDGDAHSSKDRIPLLDNEKSQQLYYVTYDNKTQALIFRHNGYEMIKEEYPFLFKEFDLAIELVIFQLKPHGKEKIDKLFLNPNDDLTPLVYFNANLFNNYTVFDPNIMRSIKTSSVLSQMIGYIRILSENSSIDFNSDRSQFLQNELTDSIKNFLYKINKKIQEIGSEKKNYLLNFDFLKTKEVASDCFNSAAPEKFIKDDFPFKDKVDIDVQDDKVVYSLFDKTATLLIRDGNSSSQKGSKGQDIKEDPIPAAINLNCPDEKEINIPSPQINLKDYIASVSNSDGNSDNKNRVIIKVDGNDLSTGILPSVDEPCEKKIEYHYTDLKTGIVIKKIRLIFVNPKAVITTKKASDVLFTIPAKDDYLINFNQYLNKLIDQINKLNVDGNIEIISCSLRVLFELSVDSIEKAQKYPLIFDNTNNLDDKVIKIINFIKSKKDYLSEIAEKTKIGFKSLGNILLPDEFERIIKKSHLGSHKSTMYITESDIRDIAKHAAFFIVLANEMINNPKIS